MAHSPTVSVGPWIAVLRGRRHLTRWALADLLDLPVDRAVTFALLTKVEAGVLTASPALVAACAKAMGTSDAALVAGPHGPDDQLAALMARIGAGLDLLDLPPTRMCGPGRCPS